MAQVDYDDIEEKRANMEVAAKRLQFALDGRRQRKNNG